MTVLLELLPKLYIGCSFDRRVIVHVFAAIIEH